MPGVFENKLIQDLTVRLTDLQSQRAELEATFTSDYPKMKQTQSQIAEIQADLDRERQRAAQKISNDYLAAVRREGLVRQAFVDKQKQVTVIAEKSVQYGILSREVDSNKTMYQGLLQRLKEAGISAGLKASNIRVVDQAKVSYIPVYPKVFLNLGLAGVLRIGSRNLYCVFTRTFRPDDSESAGCGSLPPSPGSSVYPISQIPEWAPQCGRF